MNQNGPQAIICPRCSAPLHANGGEPVLHCNYCGTAVAPPTVPMQMQMPAPYAGGGAYPQTQPQAGFASFEPQAQPHSFPQQQQPWAAPPYGPSSTNASSTRAAIGGSIAALVVLLLVVGTTLAMAFRSGNQGSIATGRGVRTVTTLPAECAPNEHLTVSHATFSGAGNAINANVNCVLVIENSTITSTTALTTTVNAKITVTDSTIVTSGTAIDLGTNGSLTVNGTSEIGSSTSDAIVGGLNAVVTLNGTKVHGLGDALKLSENPKLAFSGADVRGATAIVGGDNAAVNLSKSTKVVGTARGIVLDSNANVDIDSSDVEGGAGAALDLQRNAVIAAVSSTLSGTRAAISTASTPEQQTLTSSTLTGPTLIGGRAASTGTTTKKRR